MPKELADITESAAHAMAARMQRTALAIPSLPIPPLDTAYVGPSEAQQQQLRALTDRPPVLLLHGFDSSSLEFRRLYPLLEAQTETWAVDLVSIGQRLLYVCHNNQRQVLAELVVAQAARFA